jgi:hypothetical protein
MLQLRIAPAVLGLPLLIPAARPAAAAVSCVGAQTAICPFGQPSPGTLDCRVDVDCVLPSSQPYPAPGYDFGARRLVVTKMLTVDGDGILRVRGGGLLVTGSGSIHAAGNGMGGQLVEMFLSGDITVETGGLVDVSSGVAFGSAGSIDLRGAAIRIDGRLLANGTGRDTYGGYITVDATGDLSVASVDASGGDRAGGGDASFYATGSITGAGPVKCSGADGGSVYYEAGGAITTTSLATSDVGATGPDGSGGSFEAYGNDTVSLSGDVSGVGQPDVDQSGGDGADFSAESLSGSIMLDALVDLSGAPSGYGGDIELDAWQDIVITGKILLGTSGQWGAGSSLTTITAGGDITVSNLIDASSPGTGGELDFEALGTLTVTKTGRIKVDGAGDQNIGSGGYLFLEGDCGVQIASGALISAKGAGGYPSASNEIWASDLTIGGTLQAGGENQLLYRTIHVLPSALILPAVPLDPPTPTALCCGGCPTTTTTTTPTTSTSSSTSTTLPPTTTTTEPLPPTTTSTEPPPPTTTTTTAPAPTTTTLPPLSSTTSSTTTSSTTSSSTSTTSSTTSSSTTSSSTTTSSAATSTSTTTPDAVTTTTGVTPTTVTTPPPTTTAPIGSSTTTTAGQEPPTTSTTVPPPGSACLVQPSGLDAAECRVGALSDTVSGSTPDALGGTATMRQLKAMLGRADRSLATADRGTKVKLNLRRARRELKAFEKAVERGIKRKRRAIDGELGEIILGLSKDAANEVGLAQAKL